LPRRDDLRPGVVTIYDYDLDSVFATLVRWGVSRFSAWHEDHGGHHTIVICGQKDGGQVGGG
jgi:hypothetical protein